MKFDLNSRLDFDVVYDDKENLYFIDSLKKKLFCDYKIIEKLSRRHPGLSQGPIDLALN